MCAVKDFENILLRYRAGEYGKEPLTMHEILVKAGKENLLQKMNIEDLVALKEKATGFMKMMFSQAIECKITEFKDPTCE